jgi:cellobiose phosphorylase
MTAVEGDLSGKQILTKVSEVSDLLEQMGRSFRDLLRKQEWIEGDAGQGWFNSYYDNSCKRVERYAKEDADTRMMLTGQVFAIMGDVADEKQIPQIVSAADRYLYRQEIGGYRLNTDFREVKMDLGRMFGFAYGEKENGAVFSHMTVMFANALYGRGFAVEGSKALKTLYDASVNFEKSRIYPGIPEYFDADGRGKYPYLTGAASWYLLTMITEVFGVKGCGGDLKVAPALLKDQFDEKGQASISLYFEGKHFTVIIENPEGKEAGEYGVQAASLNGRDVPVEEKALVIPRNQVEGLGAENRIRVVLG